MTQSNHIDRLLLFKFKGSRNYVHGPDIFNAISREFQEGSVGWIKHLRFNFLLKANARLLIGDSLQNCSKDIFSASGVAVADDGKDLPFALLPLDDSSIRERYEYNEQEIVDRLILCRQDKSIQLVTQAPFSLIEEAVAAVKELNNQLISPLSGKKWLFTGINLNRRLPVNRSGATLVILRRQIIAHRFSRNELYLDSQCFGVIEFTIGDS